MKGASCTTIPRLPGDPARQCSRRGCCVHHQLGNAGYGRDVRCGVEQLHIDESAGFPGGGPGPDSHRRPFRPRAGHDRCHDTSAVDHLRIARLDGDPEVITTLASLLVHFAVGFEIMPSTVPAEPEATTMGDFEQEPLGDSAGG